MVHPHPHARSANKAAGSHRTGAQRLAKLRCVRALGTCLPFCRWQDAKRAFNGDNAVHLTVPQGLRVHAAQPPIQVRILHWLLLFSWLALHCKLQGGPIVAC